MRFGLVAIILTASTAAAFAQTSVQAPPPGPTAAGADAQRSEMQDLLAIARETAKSTREGVDYSRVVPDILTQILAKLDKIEDKLDRIDAKLGEAPRPARRTR